MQNRRTQFIDHVSKNVKRWLSEGLPKDFTNQHDMILAARNIIYGELVHTLDRMEEVGE